MPVRSLRKLLTLINGGLVVSLLATGAWVLLARPTPRKRDFTATLDGVTDDDRPSLEPLEHFRPIASLALQPHVAPVVKDPVVQTPREDPNLLWIRSTIRLKEVVPSAVNAMIVPQRGPRQDGVMWFAGREKVIDGRRVKLVKVDTDARSGWFLMRGRTYQLTLGGGASAGGHTGGGSSPEGPGPGPGGRPGVGPAPANPGGGKTVRINSGRWKLSRAETLDVFNNSESHLSTMSILPHSSGGRVIGLRLTDLPASSLAYQRGFRKGDIVTQVNHLPVTSLAEIPKIKSQLRHARLITVRYQRNGRERTMTFQLDR